MNRGKFERLVRRAIESLPDRFLERLDNVDVVVEDAPSSEQAQEHGLAAGETLFGLYEGTPQVDRIEYSFAVPDKITIFQGGIEEFCRNEREIVEQVRLTVVHEIAHHFGISDDALHEMGLS